MFCTKCGKQLCDQDKFCPECGAAIEVAQPITNTQRPQKDKLHVIDSGNGKRSEVYLSCNVPPSQAVQIAEQILTQNGFKPRNCRGEDVWRRGTGMLTAVQFVKVAAFDDVLGIQAWVLLLGVGDVGLREQCLDGYVDWISKKLLFKVVEQIQGAI